MLQSQCYDIRITSLDHRSCLRSGTSVRLDDFHFLTELVLIILLKQRIVCLVEFTRRIVGNIRDRNRIALLPAASGEGNGKKKRYRCEAPECATSRAAFTTFFFIYSCEVWFLTVILHVLSSLLRYATILSSPHASMSHPFPYS